jgi:hypothetical protein
MDLYARVGRCHRQRVGRQRQGRACGGRERTLYRGCRRQACAAQRAVGFGVEQPDRADDVDFGHSLGVIGQERPVDHRLERRLTVDEGGPFGREVILETKQQRLRRLLRVHERLRQFGGRLRAERIAGFARGVADVQDDVRDGRVVERPQVRRQSQGPGADCARPLEGQEALVVQARLEQAAVVRGAAGDDDVGRAEIIDEADVALPGAARVDAVGEQRRDAQGACLQAQREFTLA